MLIFMVYAHTYQYRDTHSTYEFPRLYSIVNYTSVAAKRTYSPLHCTLLHTQRRRRISLDDAEAGEVTAGAAAADEQVKGLVVAPVLRIEVAPLVRVHDGREQVLG